uniref:Transmembrane protein n=1 Tax=Plectus sambesii TaxID=2011161 RepID=A0A914UU17_9BILA
MCARGVIESPDRLRRPSSTSSLLASASATGRRGGRTERCKLDRACVGHTAARSPGETIKTAPSFVYHPSRLGVQQLWPLTALTAGGRAEPLRRRALRASNVFIAAALFLSSFVCMFASLRPFFVRPSRLSSSVTHTGSSTDDDERTLRE